MKAVIFAGGKGTRMGESSSHTPKPMLKVFDKNLIEHKLDILPLEIHEVIIVVGHLREVITEYFGDAYATNGRDIKITYVEQNELLGTAHCLSLCKEHLINESKFLVMMGDDIYSKDDVEECFKYDHSILVHLSQSLLGKAKVVIDAEGDIEAITEKWAVDEPGFINAAMYTLTPEIFAYPMVPIGGGEFGLPQTIMTMRDKFKIKAVKSTFWIQISSPQDLKTAEMALTNSLLQNS